MDFEGKASFSVISDRRQRVLAALIEEYVARALPVGSRTIAEHYGLGVSSATVRNDLSALEEEGYISQPHTSAGRIPTDSGYRAFVDELIDSGSIVDDPSTEETVQRLRKSASELDELIDRTSRAISEFTDCLSVVTPPHLAHPRRLGIMSLMKQPEFAYTEALLPIMQVLEDDTVLLHVLDTTAADEEDPQVRIGRENESEQLSGVSVVACRYGVGMDGGIVAVIGPTRMDYTKALTAVRIASKALGEE